MSLRCREKFPGKERCLLDHLTPFGTSCSPSFVMGAARWGGACRKRAVREHLGKVAVPLCVCVHTRVHLHACVYGDLLIISS
jgi:hypothetical protein